MLFHPQSSGRTSAQSFEPISSTAGKQIEKPRVFDPGAEAGKHRFTHTVRRRPHRIPLGDEQRDAPSFSTTDSHIRKQTDRHRLATVKRCLSDEIRFPATSSTLHPSSFSAQLGFQ
jgi:hypothetical protein